MPSIESKERTGKNVQSRTLSNVQIELLKLYSTDVGQDDLMELRQFLANYFAQKAVKGADAMWNQKKMSDRTMEDWVNEHG